MAHSPSFLHSTFTICFIPCSFCSKGRRGMLLCLFSYCELFGARRVSAFDASMSEVGQRMQSMWQSTADDNMICHDLTIFLEWTYVFCSCLFVQVLLRNGLRFHSVWARYRSVFHDQYWLKLLSVIFLVFMYGCPFSSSSNTFILKSSNAQNSLSHRRYRSVPACVSDIAIHTDNIRAKNRNDMNST
jgi:hypothetical protein